MTPTQCKLIYGLLSQEQIDIYYYDGMIAGLVWGFTAGAFALLILQTTFKAYLSRK